ncbi:hypothetical protein EDB81DRAFT_789401 [Dactylonectria macrodidyma]|uniref:WSC domain-containing protein n=1 Tax=Dactylonectria macrodidyma TaxID=307937 RepID=A0A9P9J7S2_9HYPO|nr:hypothetical protein EDB81DRAFT_789401 [Dactylonectria macrodidyma]
MAKVFLVGTLSILAAATASATRPDPPDGWVRVGCFQIDSSYLPIEYPLVDQNDCISRCASSKTGSHFAAIGDACRCAKKSLEGLNVVTTDEDRCKASCYSDDPDSNTCGALIGGIQYYDLYKVDSDDVTVTKKPGYPPPIGTSATSAETSATDSQLTTTDSHQDGSHSSSATSTAPSSAQTGSNTAQASETGTATGSNTAQTDTATGSNTAQASASETSENSGPRSNPYAFGAVVTAMLLIIASFLD